MVINVQFVKMKLLTWKLGAIEINIDPSIFVKFVFLNYGFKFFQYSLFWFLFCFSKNKATDNSTIVVPIRLEIAIIWLNEIR